MEAFVDNEVKLLQLFLTDNQIPGPGIYEVVLNKSDKVLCNCQTFTSRKSCKHSKLVQSRLDSHDGLYPIELIKQPTAEEAQRAGDSYKETRDFIIKFAKIEVV